MKRREGYLWYGVRRAVQAVVVIVLAYTLTFWVISVLPGDPVTNTLRNPQNGFSEEEITRIVSYYGLDQPVWVQWWEAFSRFVVGDLGVSLRSRLPVDRMISEALPSTLALAGTALVVAVVLAFAVAYGAKRLPFAWGRSALRAFPSLFLSVPNFVIGMLLLQFFAFQLGVFNVIDPESLSATFFAALALSIPVSAQLAEVLITGLDHESQQEYATVARSRGLSESVLFLRHLLRPASLPVVTVFALMVGELLGGAVITEAVFGRSGVGTLMQRSVATQDLPVLQAIVSLAAVVFVVINLAADLSYPLLDPRVKRETTATRPAPAEDGRPGADTAASDKEAIRA